VTTAEIVIVVVVAVAVLIALAVALSVMSRRRGRRQLRQQFGPEYDRTLATTGDPKETDAQLRERVNERERLRLRPLSRVDRDTFAQEWRQIQSRFVDAPEESLANADGLLSRVMRESGYPVDNFDQQADLVSVDHPQLVDNYRQAHLVRDATQQGPVDTEQQRNALLAYRSLFAELLDQSESEQAEPRTASS
jgi:hypothetical protein